jgi:hypothetical protein
LRAAEQRLDAVLEAALEGDGDDFAGFDDFDALEAQPVDQASPPPLHAAGEIHVVCLPSCFAALCCDAMHCVA